MARNLFLAMCVRSFFVAVVMGVGVFVPCQFFMVVCTSLTKSQVWFYAKLLLTFIVRENGFGNACILCFRMGIVYISSQQ